MDDNYLDVLKQNTADNSKLEEILKKEITPAMQSELFDALRQSQLYLPVMFSANMFEGMEDAKEGDVFQTTGKEGFDILLTHAPCKGYGDMEDIPHQGFECFNSLLERTKPKLHVYGHIHKEYSGAVLAGTADQNGARASGIKGFRRQIEHPSGTTLINASGYQLIEI